ncbi:MAG: transglycosylase domain-containing protein [Saprospirales bacterium]|nr:transglycosylase domain-containing protein [Saprospirales bacterium]
MQEARMPVYRKIVKWMWYVVGGAFALLFLLFFLLSFSNLPDTKELENPKSTLASEVYAYNGEVLGRFFIENRVPVEYNELSPNLVNALIATEDERFYKHSGIDLEALGRVLVKTAILRQKSTGGGSTITQQLAKLLFTGKPATKLSARVVQKLKEWIIAVRLERRYTKEEIMAMYLNKFDFLNNGDGIKAAAEVYFSESQDSLNLVQSATLIGMLKNPALFNPIRRPDTVLHRRNVVLNQMERNGALTKAEYDSLKMLPLDIRYRRTTHNDGLATYFRGEISKDVSAILNREEIRKPDGSNYNLYRDGLKVYTTIDPVIQKHMEIAMAEHMQSLQSKFDRHWKNLNPWTYKDKETTPAEMASRERKLSQLIRESDRYVALREEYLGQIAATLEADIEGLNLRDVDIDRMLREEAKEGAIKQMVKDNMITRRMESEYRSVLRSPYWGELKQKWDELQEAVKTTFETPVKMRVFTYENESFEKDTVMSPLDSLKYHHHFLQIGSMAIQPSTGYVKGWVGGINYRYFKYDHVRTRRQVGSTFKPFVYATAIKQQGISPCFRVPDQPQTIFPGEGNFGLQESWTPSNAEGTYSGNLYTLKDGLKYSKNTVSVFLMKQLMDAEPVRDLINQMGIDKEAKYPNGRLVVPRAPSICLGATDLSVTEMTGAYTTFANNGIYHKPQYILRIEDRNGRVLYEEDPDERIALDEQSNFVMVEMLKYAANMGGLKSEVGGKTGTTNNFVDGWFMGITPSLVVGTWVGGDDRWIRFRSLDLGQGSVMAKPFFKALMVSLEKDPDAEYDTAARFAIPKGDLTIELDCTKYMQRIHPESGGGSFDEFSEDMFGDEEYNIPDSTRFLH